MNLPAYPKYKPSGVEWLGSVPEHWKVKRLKTSATYCVSNVDKVSAEDELPVRLCNYTDVYYNDYIVPDMPFMETTATPSEIRRFGLKSNDVLITKDSEEWSDIAVPAMVRETAPDLVCGYHLAMVSPSPDALCGEFLLRCFQSCAVNQQFQIAASGVTRYGLPKSSIGEAWLPLPSIAEQRVIAAFLDERTGKLDALAEKKRGLIDKLKEKRSALISRTVTKGLPAEAGLPTHPNLKPSGIDWLGDIPEHWEAVPLGYLLLMRGGATPDKSKAEYWDGSIPWVSPKDMKVATIADAEDHISEEALIDSPLSLIPTNAVLIVVRGMILAHSFPVALTTATVTINQDMKALVAGTRIKSRYLFWALCGFKGVCVSLADESAHGTRKLETATLTRFVFPLPFPAEQIAIADYLDRETAKIDRMIEKVEAAIEKLVEYRTALITAAVTGKIDVRGVVKSAVSTSTEVASTVAA